MHLHIKVKVLKISLFQKELNGDERMLRVMSTERGN